MPCIILHKYKKSNILWKKTLESLERWVVSPHLADRLAHLAVYFTQLAASLSLCTMENWNRFRFTLINFFGPICHFLTGVGPTYEKQYLKLPA